MKFLYVKLTGYIGLYNGLGLSEIEIDFTKSKNNITVISGPNGVGKSTIINAFNILPDKNECFVPTMNASKYIKLTDGENLYEINIVHPLDKHNRRETSKAFINKNGLELNSNGNISSYKEIIFSEFDMDANYITLSKISGENRGLADKRPAERKKIMSSLISSLEVYNNIYKILNKKANIFKSHINKAIEKIKNVGDEESLRNTLKNLQEKHIRLVELIGKAKEKIIELTTIISLNDPNGEMQNEYNNISNLIIESENNKNSNYKKLSQFIDQNSLQEESKNINDNIKELEFLLSKNSEEQSELKVKLDMILNFLSTISSDIDDLEIKIKNMSSDIDETLIKNINIYSEKIKIIEDDCSKLGISNIEEVSKNEIDILINTIIKIISMIDSLYESMSTDQFSELELYFYNRDINQDIIEIEESINNINNIIIEDKETLSIINNDIKSIEVLQNRPKTCNDDNCHFIKNALSILKKYGNSIDDVLKVRNKYKNNIENNTLEIENLSYNLEKKKKVRNLLIRINSIIDIIDSNNQILSKFSITSNIIDKNKFLELICRENRFNELREIDRYLELGNSIIEYKSNLKILNELQMKMEINKNNMKIINQYEKDLDKKKDERQIKNEEYCKIRKDLDFLNNIILVNKTKLDKLNVLNEYNNIWLESIENHKRLEDRSNEIKKKFESSLSILTEIAELKEYVQKTSIELEPIIEQMKSIELQLIMLDSYKQEYEMYQEKFDFVDKLRKYSSPTQGGIQSLFMSIYMDKTLSMVNQLLGMIFNGQYRIVNYVINEDEFRIPFIGNGLPVDDISSGSTSQVCIMGMIINLVLSNISSSKYNIISLDEIDGGLDHVNKYMFVDVLQKICSILEIEQLFIISHSVESALSNVDVILLSDSQEYIDQFSSANIIYQFKSVI